MLESTFVWGRVTDSGAIKVQGKVLIVPSPQSDMEEMWFSHFAHLPKWNFLLCWTWL